VIKHHAVYPCMKHGRVSLIRKFTTKIKAKCLKFCTDYQVSIHHIGRHVGPMTAANMALMGPKF
jgi:hypothetical protein